MINQIPKPLTIVIIALALLPFVVALPWDRWDAGSTFTPPDSNVTYYATEDIECITLVVNETCLIILGGDFEGTYCNTSGTPTTIYLGSPTISGVNLTINNLLYGNQSYNITYTATDVDNDLMTCWVIANGQNVTLSYDNPTDICSGTINIAQDSTNSFVPWVSDGTTTDNATAETGVEIIFDQYLADELYTNSLAMQRFRAQYNFTSGLAINYTDINWSLNATDDIKTVNLTAGATTQNAEERHSNDYLTEDTDFTIAGTVFYSQSPYNIYKVVVFNNTNSEPLPAINLTITLDYYRGSELAEYQSGILWPDINSTWNGTAMTFNLSAITSGSTQNYRYSYDATIVNWTGESIADYYLAAERRRWNLDRVYAFNFVTANKTVRDNISTSAITEWVSRIAGTVNSTLTENVTGSDYTHTTTEFTSYAMLSFTDANSTMEYDYTLLFDTLAPITGSESGGGGGGGGIGCIPEGESCHFDRECCDGMACIDRTCQYERLDTEEIDDIEIIETESDTLSILGGTEGSRIPSLRTIIREKFPNLKMPVLTIPDSGIMKYLAWLFIIIMLCLLAYLIYLIFPYIVTALSWLLSNPVGWLIIAAAVIIFIIKYFM